MHCEMGPSVMDTNSTVMIMDPSVMEGSFKLKRPNSHEKNHLQMDVAPWGYKWTDGFAMERMDLWVG